MNRLNCTSLRGIIWCGACSYPPRRGLLKMENKNMNEERQEVVQVNEGTPRWLGVAVVALAAVSLLGLGVGWSASNHAREAQTATVNDAKVLRQNLDVVTQRLTQAEAVNAQVQGDLSVVTDRLKLTQGEL